MIPIYRSTFNGINDDCPLNLFCGKEEVERDAVVLKTKKTLSGKEYTYAEPVEPGSWAFGGTILFTSNGIYPEFTTPIKLHDRDMRLEV